MRSGPRESSRRFSDADIRAIVSKARYSDPRATDYITATLIERRNKVLKTWLTVRESAGGLCAADPTAGLTFTNAAVDVGRGDSRHGISRAMVPVRQRYRFYDGSRRSHHDRNSRGRLRRRCWRRRSSSRSKSSRSTRNSARWNSPRHRAFPAQLGRLGPGWSHARPVTGTRALGCVGRAGVLLAAKLSRSSISARTRGGSWCSSAMRRTTFGCLPARALRCALFMTSINGPN